MRVTVWLFGDSPPMIRLPAFLFAVATVPLPYVAGRAVASRRVGLAAAALYVGSGYAHELAVNARGYTIGNRATLAAVPGVLKSRAVSVAVLAASLGIGCWAVPVMVFPAAVIVTWGAAQVVGGRGYGLMPLAVAMIAGGLSVASVYALPFVVAGLREDGVARTVTGGQELSIISRAVTTLTKLDVAARQFAAPFGAIGAVLFVSAATAGYSLLSRRRDTRYLPFTVLLAPIAVFAASGFASPPWWIGSFAFPPMLICIAVTLSAAIDGTDPNAGATAARRRAVTTAVAVTLCRAGAGYGRPVDVAFFGTVGCHDARRTVERLTEGDLVAARAVSPESPIYVRPIIGPPVTYYARNIGEGRPRCILVDKGLDVTRISPGALVIWAGHTDVWRRELATPPARSVPLAQRVAMLDRTGDVATYRVTPVDASQAGNAR